DRHFDEDIDRRAEAARRREAPLTHGVDRLLIQSRAETAQHFDVADTAVAADDDLEHDVPFDTLAASLIGVRRLDLSQQRGRVDARARPIRTAARTAAAAGTDARAGAFADARACPRARAPA